MGHGKPPPRRCGKGYRTGRYSKPIVAPRARGKKLRRGVGGPNGFLISSFIEGSAEIASRNLASEWDAFSALRPLGKARPGIRRQNGMCFPFAVFGGNCVPDPALRTGCAFRPPTSGAYVHLGAPSRARPDIPPAFAPLYRPFGRLSARAGILKTILFLCNTMQAQPARSEGGSDGEDTRR